MNKRRHGWVILGLEGHPIWSTESDSEIGSWHLLKQYSDMAICYSKEVGFYATRIQDYVEQLIAQKNLI